MKTHWLACLAFALGGCPNVEEDANEGIPEPTVEFDPANKIIPFPNNLLLDPATGKVNLPEQCNESPTSAATRLGALNKLDGFGTYETSMNVTFTEPVDLASLDGRVLLFQRAALTAEGPEAVDPFSAVPVPVIAIPGKTTRFTNQADIKACTDPVMVDQVTFVATVPLEQKSIYTVALLAGIKTESGADFSPSFTWSLVREPLPVVELDEAGNVITNLTPLDPLKAEDKESLEGIDLLWNAHHDAVSFLGGTGHDSSELLLAWEFKTQTTTDPLDPSVEGSPASTPTVAPMIGIQSLSALATARAGLFAECVQDDPIDADPVVSDTQCLLRILFGVNQVGLAAPPATIYLTGRAICAGGAGCANIGNVLGGAILSKQYQTDVDNTGYTGTGTQPVPGAWNDPISPTVVHDTAAPDFQSTVTAAIFIPKGTRPTNGWPVAIFQHGIARSRNDVLGIAGALTGLKSANPAFPGQFAVVAIDAPNHGSRAVRISNVVDADPELDCSDVLVGLPSKRPDNGPDPVTHGHCYAPPFSADLAATRDGFRQSVLDIQQLVTSLKTCGNTACGNVVKVDPTKFAYVGTLIIGGNLGGIVLGTTPNLQAGVLNVSGAGWMDILENTGQREAFQCPLVDALIDAGSLVGDKFDKDAGTGLCTTDAWKTEPGYRQFAVIGRWVLDPSDPANFNRFLASSRFLLQRVDKDDVVPNVSTDNEGALVEQLKADASCGIPLGGPTPAPSTALLAVPTENHFLDYVTGTPPGTAGCAPGNKFTHGSLLKPEAGTDGTLATARLQTDMVFFLLANLDLLP